MGETGIFPGWESIQDFWLTRSQADKILDFLRRFRKEKTMVLVDPVMGDNGSAYGIYTEGLAGTDDPAGEKRTGDHPQSDRSIASFIWERRDGKKIRRAFGTGWRETAGTD